MAPSNLLFSLLMSLLLVMLTQKVHSQTSFNINAFTPHSLLLTYERDAFVPPDTTYVRLVPGAALTRVSVGRVLYSAPVRLWDQRTQASFETTITFQTTSLNSSATTHFGMTFFIVPVNSTTTRGGAEGNLGIYDTLISGSAIFAVEFDLYPNSFGPSNPHIGININSRRSQNLTRIANIRGELVTARITYDVPTRMISVVATYGSTTATVSFAFNLKALLPQQVQLGLSASTGLSNTFWSYDVFTWHFNSTMVSDVNSVVDDNTYIKQYGM